MENELVSVVIPTYNREKTIKRSVDSVLNQTYDNIEVIVVDDCSTDKTYEVIKQYNDKRVRYYKLEKNSGACVARNFGIKQAKGKYIAFQDSDDEWYKNKIEFQIKNLVDNKSDIDFCEYEKIDEKNCIKFPNEKSKYYIKRFGIEKALRYGNFISTQLLLVKKECFNYYLFDKNLPRLQDYDLVLMLSSKFKFSYTKHCLVTLFVQDDSISKSNEKLKKSIDIMFRKKYKYEKILFSHLYMLLATNCDKKDKRYYYGKALKVRFSIKTLIKLLLNY